MYRIDSNCTGHKKKRRHPRMKKPINALRRIAATAAIAVTAGLALAPIPAFADSQRIVTIGADLTQSEENTVLDFFGLTENDLNQMEVITVTNEDERSYLEGSISTDVIGNETLSCSYIEPTTSGGINVETANLTYVTKNTLYNALQTAGVENVNLVVTAPYDVSGTGALTGVFMAYEKSGQALDEDKEQAATEEMVETAQLEDTYGEDVASVISDVKNDVVSQGSDLTTDDILALIDKYAQSRGLSLSDADRQTIADIANRVQGLEYDSDAFSTTLDDIKEQIAGVSDKIDEKADGILGAIQSFFEAVGNFFSNLFASITGQQQDAANDNANASNENMDDAHSTSGILGSLNTDVFELDNAGAGDSAENASDNENDGVDALSDDGDDTAAENGNENDVADGMNLSSDDMSDEGVSNEVNGNENDVATDGENTVSSANENESN